MDERILQARVGIMVISTMLLTAILVVLFGKFPTPFKEGKTIYVRFTSAPGVAVGTPVRKSGVLIGRVDAVTLLEDSPDVMVTVRLNPGVKVFDNEVCRITATLLGDATLEFVPGPEKPQEKKLIASGVQLKGVVYSNPLEMLNHLEGDVKNTLQSVSTAGNDVGKLAANINKLIEGKDTGRLDAVLTKTEAAMENFQKAMGNLNDLVGDEKVRASIKTSLADLPKLMKDVHQATAGMQSVVSRADRNLENLEHLTGPLGERGAQIAARLDSSVSQLDQFMRQLVDFTAKFNNQQGSLGLLINNPDLYNELTAATRNINQLTQQMRPILGDVRVFTDKMAREGIRGVIRKTDGTKYPNFGNVDPPPADWRDPVPVTPGASLTPVTPER